MNRQMQRRVERNLGLNKTDIDDLSKYFAKKGQEDTRDVVVRFLGICMEALRLEFGFGNKRLERFGAKVDSLLDCINLDYVDFDEILEDLSIKNHVVHKIDWDSIKKGDKNEN